MSYKWFLASFLGISALGLLTVGAGQVPIIPQELLFGNPTYASPQISPDGKQIAFVAPHDGVMNIFVQPVGQTEKPRAVTNDRSSGIGDYWWSYDSSLILYMQHTDGDENWNIYKVDLATGTITALTPFPDVTVEVVQYSKKFPDRMLIAMNKDDKRLHDIYLLNILTGELEFVEKNSGDSLGSTADDNLQVRTLTRMEDDGGISLYHRAKNGMPWKQILREDEAGFCGCVGFGKHEDELYLIDSTESATARLVKFNVATGAKEVILADNEYDAGSSLFMHPQTDLPIFTSIQRAEKEIIILDETYRGDIEFLKSYKDCPFGISSCDMTFNLWVVMFYDSNVPGEYYLYDRTTKSMQFLGTTRPELCGYCLAKTEPITFAARDGLAIHGYITYPTTTTARKNLPLALFVHGGPQSRDTMNGCSPLVQLLANRGYICLQVNYRGSTGYGKSFVKAGYKEWGRAMQHDLTDAVAWLTEQGIVDSQRVTIIGASYGGYAALAGAAFTPDLYRCAVDLCGVSNLITLIASIPPYWTPFLARMYKAIGNPDTERQLLEERSPLFSAHKICIPLLIGQGANDPRVKQAEAEQIVAALKERGASHEYLLFANEGHGLARPENRLKFFRVMEQFLATHLGGRCEENSRATH